MLKTPYYYWQQYIVSSLQKHKGGTVAVVQVQLLVGIHPSHGHLPSWCVDLLSQSDDVCAITKIRKT